MTGALLAVAGLAVLVVSSGRFVAGAAGLSLRLRVPPVVVGAVVIGFGTSAPELLTSGLAAAEGSHDIAVGNVVGSNVANLTLVLGVLAVTAAPAITSQVLRREVPLAVAGMLAFAATLQRLERWSALALLVAFVAVMIVLLRASRVSDDALADDVERELDRRARRPTRSLVLECGAALLGTVAGAQLLVSGAVSVAESLDVGEGLIGFTLVALGTSAPEIVTSVQAARRGEPDLAIGNVFGSNLFNSLAIGGIVGLISPGDVADGLIVTAWCAVGAGVLVGGLMRSGRRLVRWEGVLLLGSYVAAIPLVA